MQCGDEVQWVKSGPDAYLPGVSTVIALGSFKFFYRLLLLLLGKAFSVDIR